MRAIVLAVALLALAGRAPAHEFHVTLAEVELDAESGALQVALQIPTLDLEDELAARAGVGVVPETADSSIVELIGAEFVVTLPDGSRPVMRWVGKEIGVHDSWLYFELPVAGGIEGARLRDSIGFARHARQVNTVNLRLGADLRSLAFTADAREQELLPPSAEAGDSQGP